MNVKDLLQLGCWFCFGASGLNVLAVVGRLIPEIGLTFVGLLVLAALGMAVGVRFNPSLAPTASFLALMAIIGLILGMVN